MGFIYLLSSFPIKFTTVVWESSSVAIKKGKRAGTTEFAHSSNPFFVADKFSLENIIKHIVKSTNKLGNICFFIEKKKKRDFI